MSNIETKNQNETSLPNSLKTSTTSTRMMYIVLISTFFALIVDGMDMNFLALSLPLLKKDFGLSMVMTGSLSTWTLLGMALGGTVAGFGDRYGRVKVWGFCMIFFSVFTGALALSNSYSVFVVLRFFAAAGAGAVYILSMVLAAEYVPAKHRSLALASLMAGWSLGFVVSSLLAAWLLPIYGWRVLFGIAIIPAIVPLLAMRVIEEPHSFQKAKAARQVNPKSGNNQFKELWADKSSRRTFILWTITSLALQFGYNGTSQWLPSYLVTELKVNLKDMGWYVAATYSATICSKLIIGWLGDRVGRRALYTFMGLATAVALPFITHYATPETLAYCLLAFGMLYAAPYAIYGTYINESFAAKIRGTAVGTAYSIARIGASMAPMFVGAVAAEYSIGLGIALMGVAYAINALVPGLFIKEKMFDTSEE